MDDPPINLVRHIRGHTADHIRPTVENGEDAGGTPTGSFVIDRFLDTAVTRTPDKITLR